MRPINIRTELPMTEERPTQALRRRATAAILENAIFDWKSGVIIALTLVLTVFGGAGVMSDKGLIGWPWWYFTIGGAVFWLALVISILTDPSANAKAVAELLRRDFNPVSLRSQVARERINKALSYRERIAETIARTREGVLREHLGSMAGQIDDWIANLYQLAQRVDTYEMDDVIHQDLKSVPLAMQNLTQKLRAEDDPSVQEQIRQTAQAKQQQWDSLKKLENMMEKAEYQMDSTITALGTVYSQLLLIGVKDIDSGRAQRLREDISEQVNTLHDLVNSVDEVYAHRA